MELDYRSYKYIPIECIEDKLKDLDKIKELKEQIKVEKNKKKILLDKINNLDIQNYLLKKRIVEYERDFGKQNSG